MSDIKRRSFLGWVAGVTAGLVGAGLVRGQSDPIVARPIVEGQSVRQSPMFLNDQTHSMSAGAVWLEDDASIQPMNHALDAKRYNRGGL